MLILALVLGLVVVGQAVLLTRAARTLRVLADAVAGHRAEVRELEEQARVHPPHAGVFVVPPDFIGEDGGAADVRA